MRLTLLLWWYRAALDKWKMLLVPAPAIVSTSLKNVLHMTDVECFMACTRVSIRENRIWLEREREREREREE